MKKCYSLSLMVMFGSFFSFAQTGQNNNSIQSISPATNQQFTGAPYKEAKTVANKSFDTPSTVSATQLAPLAPSGPVPAGQHVCKTHELNQKHYEERGLKEEFNQEYLTTAMNTSSAIMKTPGVNEISVIFHVVHNPNNPAENVSNALIMQVWQDLTEDFQLLNADASNARTNLGFNPADANINFCLATQDESGTPLAELGVVRVATSEDWYDSDNGEENKMKSSATGGSDIWNRNNYLNVYICDITNGANSGTAGYAYRPTTTLLPSPGIDGIVLDYNLGMNNDNVLTHEVGHYLGLDHTWGGSGGCGLDDGFTDTPNTAGPSFNYAGSCSGSQQTCSGVNTQYENYMDYSNCTVMFTQEQANYMLGILQGVRSSLLLSPGCDPTNLPPNSAFTSLPSGPSPVIIPQNASVSFLDQSTNAPTGWTWTISGTEGTDWAWVNSTNQNSQNPVAEFYSVGTYDVTLTASNAYGADATPASEPVYIQVAATASGISCDTLRNWNTASTSISTTGWSSPSSGYVHGNATIASAQALEWAEIYNTAVSTDVRAVEIAPIIVNDAGGNITVKVWNDNGGQPAATPITTETVALSSFTEGVWRNIEFTTPATGITGNFWVGYELSGNVNDSLVVYSHQTTAAANTTSWRSTDYGWLTIPATTSNAIGIAGLMNVLTSTGPAPSMSFTATADSVCVAGDIVVDGSGSTNNIDYRWYVTNNPWVAAPLETSNSSSNTFNFPYAPGSYIIYLFGDGSCVTDGAAMAVEVLTPVSATATPSATTCGLNNGIITVTGAVGGDGNYQYSIDGTNYQSSNTFTGLAPGNYDVYVATAGDECSAMYSVTIAGSTGPTVSAGANQEICQGQSATITASGGNTYVWSNGVSTVGSGNSLSVTPANTTQYSCLITDGSGCQATVFTTVTVNIPVQPTITATATTICSGATATLTSSAAIGNTWSTTATGSSINVTTAGSYTVTTIDGNGCSSTSAPTIITVNPSPTISAGTVSNPSTCATATGSIQITGSGSGDLSWTGTSTGNVNGTALPYTIPSLSAGAYNITLVDGNGCSSNLVSQALNDPTPPVTPTISASGATTFCDGGSVVLTSSYGSGNTWSTTDITGSINVTSSGTYFVTYTDGTGCSATSIPLTVTVNPNPSTPIITAGGPTTFCQGDMVTLTSSQGTGNVWSTTETTQSIDVSTAGSITLVYTDANGCSATSAATDITINPLPNVSFGNLSTLCDYNPAYTLNEGTPSGGTYSGTGVTGGQFDPSVAGVGTHTLTYEYTDGNGCVNTATSDIVVDGCLGIEDFNSAEVKIYPNPTDADLTIELSGDFTFVVLDTRGRVITEGAAFDVFTINTTDFEAGVYFVTVESGDFTKSTRIVKR